MNSQIASQLNSITRNLQPGDQGGDVIALQQALVSMGYLPASEMSRLGYGYYGDLTKNAVAKMQSDFGIPTNGNPGFFGPVTQSSLKTLYSAPTTPTQTTPVQNTPVTTPAPTSTPVTTTPQITGSGTADDTVALANLRTKLQGMGLPYSMDGIRAAFQAATGVVHGTMPSTNEIIAFNNLSISPAAVQNAQNILNNTVTPTTTPTTPTTTPTTPTTGTQTGSQTGQTSSQGITLTDLSKLPSMTIGSFGPNVETLQKFLMEKGFLSQADYATGPGTYGNKTANAVKQWQLSMDIDPNTPNLGSFGPITKQLATIAGSKITASGKDKEQLNIAATPDVQSVNSDGTITLGNGQTITRQAYDNLVNENKAMVNLYYDQSGQNRAADVETKGNFIANDYTNSLRQLFNDYTIKKEGQDDAEGRAGTWASSARAKRLGQLNEGYQLKADSMFNQAQRNLQDTYREGEYNIGNNFNKMGLSTTTFNAPQSKRVGAMQTTNAYNYNPFGFAGLDNSQRKLAINSINSGTLSSSLSGK